MNIILTGSTGGIGSTIKQSCIESNHNVFCLSRDSFDLSLEFTTELSSIDGLIYCAGINRPCNYKELTKQNLIDTIQVNTFSFIELCKQIKFNNGANIIAIGSLYATETRSGRLAYTVSKHGMYGAVKTLAIEMASDNIKVNMISPGFVLTSLTEKNNSKDRIQYLQNNIPLGMTQPSDIAELCVFLLNNRNITGQNIIVDGGYSLLGI